MESIHIAHCICTGSSGARLDGAGVLELPRLPDQLSDADHSVNVLRDLGEN